MERYRRDNVVSGQFPFVAIARAAMFADKTGFVKQIHEPRLRRGPRRRDRSACRPRSCQRRRDRARLRGDIETVGDSIAAHPTLSEGFKEAALVALGRPIHMPPKRKR